MSRNNKDFKIKLEAKVKNEHLNKNLEDLENLENLEEDLDDMDNIRIKKNSLNFDSEEENLQNINKNFKDRLSKRGNVYIVRDSISSSDNDDYNAEYDINNIINELAIDSLNMSKASHRKARIFKGIHIMIVLFTIVAGVAVGVLSLEGNSNNVTLYIAAILGFIISAVHTLSTTFSFEKRSVVLKEAANRLRRIYRDLSMVKNSDMTIDAKIKVLNDKYSEVDEIDLTMFDNNVTNNKSFKTNSSQTLMEVSKSINEQKKKEEPSKQSMFKKIFSRSDINKNESNPSPRFINFTPRNNSSSKIPQKKNVEEIV